MPARSARDVKIEENLGLVHACARRFTGRGVEYDDLLQAGCIGLIKAVDRFDESRGFSFSTYAVPVILGEIRRIFRDDGTVRVSRMLRDRGRRIAQAREAFAREYQREPTVGELAALLGLSETETAQAINAALPALSLTREGEGGNNAAYDLPTASCEGAIADRVALRQVMERLDERDRLLLEYRYFHALNQTKTAALLGMTQVQVSRREKAILQKLRRELL